MLEQFETERAAYRRGWAAGFEAGALEGIRTQSRALFIGAAIGTGTGALVALMIAGVL